MASISLVIPVYNSEESIQHLCEQLYTELPKITDDFEIIFVNDGSTDKSWECIKKLLDKYSNIVGIDLIRNFGQHNALLVGIRQAKHEVIVTMDDDLQHPPSEIWKLTQALDHGYDVIYGTNKKLPHGFFRNFSSILIKKVLRRISNNTVPEHISAFRAFKADLKKSFEHYSGTVVSIEVLLTWGTSHFGFVEVEYQKRKYGKSNYNLIKLIGHTLNLLTGFSTYPLRLVSFAGFSFTFLGIGILIYVIGNYIIRGGSVPGFSFLASIVTIFSGIILFSLGVFGEYLAHIFLNTTQRPQSIIRKLVKPE